MRSFLEKLGGFVSKRMVVDICQKTGSETENIYKRLIKGIDLEPVNYSLGLLHE